MDCSDTFSWLSILGCQEEAELLQKKMESAEDSIDEEQK